jgi:hypothetical protein
MRTESTADPALAHSQRQPTAMVPALSCSRRTPGSAVLAFVLLVAAASKSAAFGESVGRWTDCFEGILLSQGLQTW